MEIQRLQMEQAMQAQSNDSNKKPGDNTPNEKRDKTKSEAPIMEEGNVSVIQ
jgi:hypothetical protein